MDLRRYLFENRITQKQFAESIDYSRAYITLIANGQITKVGRKFARAVQKATNGVVTLEDLCNHPRRHRCRKPVEETQEKLETE